MFSVVHSTLVQPLPFHEPDRLVDRLVDAARRGRRSIADVVSRLPRLAAPGDLVRRARGRPGAQPDADRTRRSRARHGRCGERGPVPRCSASCRRSAARSTPTDDQPGAGPVVVLTDQLWRRRYNADPDIVGQAIPINGRPHTVVGVLPADVNFPFLQMAYVALAPLAHDAPRGARDLAAVRPAQGGRDDRAGARGAGAVAARLAAAHAENTGWGAHVRPLRDYFAPDEVKVATVAALGAVTLVLLIACANVANLLLARATSRAREMSLARRPSAPDAGASCGSCSPRRSCSASCRSRWASRSPTSASRSSRPACPPTTCPT